MIQFRLSGLAATAFTFLLNHFASLPYFYLLGLFYSVCISILPTCMCCVVGLSGACGGQKRSYSLELPIGMVGTEPSFSARVASALIFWVSSPAVATWITEPWPSWNLELTAQHDQLASKLLGSSCPSPQHFPVVHPCIVFVCGC